MALPILMIFLLALLSRNAQAIIALDSLEEDVAFELELGEQPWLALLEIPGGAVCSGTIVSPTALLSAASCLKGATRPARGVAYAGNVKYRVPKDFHPPTQIRSVVDYVLYDENNTLEYNIMLVKIAPKWIWTSSVQPVGVIDVERLPEKFTASCFMSGLGDGSDNDSGKVARAAGAWIGARRACADSPQPLDHRLCAIKDSGLVTPRAGDVGGPVLCEWEPEDKLYAIISEHVESISDERKDPDKMPSHVGGFQFVGFYMSWINKTAGDLPSDADVKSLRLQHEHDFPLPLGLNGMFPDAGRDERDDGNSSNGGPPSSETAGTGNGTGNGTTGSGAGRLHACVPALLAAPLAVALRGLF